MGPVLAQTLRLAVVGEVAAWSGARVLRISRSYGVTASTLDSESSDRGSNPRRTLFLQRHVGPACSVVIALPGCPRPLGTCGMAALLKQVVLNLATAFVTCLRKSMWLSSQLGFHRLPAWRVGGAVWPSCVTLINPTCVPNRKLASSAHLEIDTCGIRTHAGRPHRLSRPTP